MAESLLPRHDCNQEFNGEAKFREKQKIHRVLWKQLNVRQISFDSVSVLYEVPLKLARSNSRIPDSSGVKLSSGIHLQSTDL